MNKVFRNLAFPVLALCVGALVLVAAHDLWKTLDYHAVVGALRGLPAISLLGALFATVLSYLGLVGRDIAALRALGAGVPARLLWLGGVTGSAVGNAVGFGALTGAAVRYRIYGAGGVGAGQVARLTVLTSAAFILGVVMMGGLGLAVAAPAIGRMLGVEPLPLAISGLIVLAAGVALVAWCRPGRPPLRLGRISVGVPARGVLLQQLALVGLDVTGAALALYVLLPEMPIGFCSFLAVYAVALLLGLIGHTPGGIGVFDAAILFATRGSVPPETTVAALLAYRAIYFILPLALSGALLAAFELRAGAARLGPRAPATIIK